MRILVTLRQGSHGSVKEKHGNISWLSHRLVDVTY